MSIDSQIKEMTTMAGHRGRFTNLSDMRMGICQKYENGLKMTLENVKNRIFVIIKQWIIY